MAFGNFEQDSAAPIADINMTPLVDVMLVLLVVFIVTAPLLSQAVKVELPRAQAAAHQEQAETIRLTIDAGGRHFWNDTPVDEAELARRLTLAGRQPNTELQLHADKATAYERVAKALALAQQSGISRIGFITQHP